MSALGLSAAKPTPPTFKYSQDDPMGTSDSQSGDDEVAMVTEGSSDADHIRLCEGVVDQITRLKSLSECVTASERVLGAMQNLISRKVIFCLLASFTLSSSSSSTSLEPFIKCLENIRLLDIKKLIKLLRLVQAGRVDRTPGKELCVLVPGYSTSVNVMECLGKAVSIVADSGGEAGSQLMQVRISGILMDGLTYIHIIIMY